MAKQLWNGRFIYDRRKTTLSLDEKITETFNLNQDIIMPQFERQLGGRTIFGQYQTPEQIFNHNVKMLMEEDKLTLDEALETELQSGLWMDGAERAGLALYRQLRDDAGAWDLFKKLCRKLHIVATNPHLMVSMGREGSGKRGRSVGHYAGLILVMSPDSMDETWLIEEIK